ncbi:MAG: 2Fe-2S iron-sulfur cluster binding domain-containing protein [Flavobacteriales bacterium]|nr:2Fe-2S iron-sulfur cluster binding domain-containing protein [Flavobacteriales bacterium]
MYSLKLINSYGEQKTLSFRSNQYRNFMQMIVDQLSEDIGDCKGSAWCGTCHVELIEGTIERSLDTNEIATLDKLSNKNNASRLACQLMVNKELDGLSFKLLSEDA